MRVCYKYCWLLVIGTVDRRRITFAYLQSYLYVALYHTYYATKIVKNINRKISLI